ncbi:MAG: hypothetical protein ACE5F1_00965 [Planctomycetota bacterium]
MTKPTLTRILDEMLENAIEADYGIQVVGRHPGNCSYYDVMIRVPRPRDGNVALSGLRAVVKAEVRKLSETMDLDGPVYAHHFVECDLEGIRCWVTFVAERTGRNKAEDEDA